MTIAYSYVRFSSVEQRKGDSLRRQTDAAAKWCEANGVKLDTLTTFHDLGRSAAAGLHRVNPDRNALARFLELVECGKISRGSYLIIENLDRLSREHIQPAMLLVLNLLQAGIRIVQLSPAVCVFDEHSDTMPVMMMMLELSRGHGESKMKSERLGAVWREKKRKAREEGLPMSSLLPGWLKMEGGKIVQIPEAVEVVKQIFKWTVEGHGIRSIVRKLTDSKVPTFRDAGTRWTTGYVSSIVRQRRAIGEYQPMSRKPGRRLQPDGPPVPGYFPQIVSEAEWLAAREAARKRGRIRGAIGSRINVFQGLLIDAINGGSYQRATSTKRSGEKYDVILSRVAQEGCARQASFPFEDFEELLLEELPEIKPADLMPAGGGDDPTIALAEELAEVQDRVSKIEKQLESDGDIAALAKVLRKLEKKAADLSKQLADARAKASCAAGEEWASVSGRNLLALARDQETAVQLRGLFRRVMEGIWVIVVKVDGRKDRFCVAQIRFIGSPAVRTYLMWYHPASANGASAREAPEPQVINLTSTGLGDPDLRCRDDAELLATELRENGERIASAFF